MSDHESENEHEQEPMSEHELLDDFKQDPAEEYKYEEERRKALEAKLKAEEEQRKAQLEKKKKLKIERLNKKIKNYESMSNKEQELAEVARKYSDDRHSRAKYYFYKKELLMKKLNMLNGVEINDHISNQPCTTEEKIKLIEFEQQLQTAFANKNNKSMLKHMVTKKYIY